MHSNQPSNASQPESAKLQTVGAALMSAAMSLPLAGQALAEGVPDRGMISLKHLDYLDSQPGNDRIKVQTTALQFLTPISGQWSTGGSVTTDGISGASPSYHNASLRKMVDRRNAIDADLTRYFQNDSLTVGLNSSTESDYLSRGFSIQGSHSTENRNTTWTAGIGVNNDTISPANKLVKNERKHVTNVLLSLTQVFTANDILQFNAGYSQGNGYFSDPYKIFDKRPRERNNHTLLTRWNHHLDSTEGTARLSYRYYSDSWEVKAHTLGLEYVQPFGHSWTVTPLVRFYSQSAANFYVDADPSYDPFPPNPPDGALYSSEDQRLSAFGAHTWGLKITKQIQQDWSVDIKLEQYTQRSSWRLFGRGSPYLLQFNARSIQVGLSRQI